VTSLYPKINEYLYIQVASSDTAEAEVEYRSRIAETDDEAFLIEIPMQESSGRLKRLFMGDELSAYFITEGGIKNYFNTHVLGFKEDVIRMVRVQKPAEESMKYNIASPLFPFSSSFALHPRISKFGIEGLSTFETVSLLTIHNIETSHL